MQTKLKLTAKEISSITKWAETINHPEAIKELFGSKQRIIVDYASSKGVRSNPKIKKFLAEHEYVITDYKAGLCAKGKQQVSIGKVLARLKAGDELIKLYANDPARAGTVVKGKKIIFTINKFDVAAMSTTRGWSSCMSLRDGCNKVYLKHDIRLGTIIAYLVNHDDLDIENPLARVAIKQFVNKNDKTKVCYRPETRVYGTAPAEFLKQVQKWCDAKFRAKPNVAYAMNSKLYNDGSRIYYRVTPAIAKVPIKDLLPIIKEDISVLKGIKNPSEELQMAAVKVNWNALSMFKVVSDKVQVEAVKTYAGCITTIKNPCDAAKIAAVKSMGHLITHIKDPSEELKLLAVKQHGDNLRYIKDPGEEVIKCALKNYPNAVRYVKNPTMEMVKDAIKRDFTAIGGINNPTKEMMAYAIECSTTSPYHYQVLAYMRDAPADLQLMAIKKNWRNINYVTRATIEMQMEAVKQTVSALGSIHNVDDSVQLFAIEQDARAIRNMDRPCTAAQMLAVKKDLAMFREILRPCREVRDYYAQKRAEEKAERARLKALVKAAEKDQPEKSKKEKRKLKSATKITQDDFLGVVIHRFDFA